MNILFQSLNKILKSIQIVYFTNLNPNIFSIMKGSSGKLTLYILIAMVLGIAVGYFVHQQSSPETIKAFSTNIKLLTTIFLRLVQMVIAPLV
jgi:L-cystine uptake protein TcyP (sodium:dicarboxylate symporter family)